MNRFQRIPIAWFHVKPESSAARRGEVELPHRSKDMQHSTQAAFLSTLAIQGSAGGHAVAMRLRPRIASPVEGNSMTDPGPKTDSSALRTAHPAKYGARRVRTARHRPPPQTYGVGVAPQSPPASTPGAAPGAWGRGSRVLSYSSASRSSCGCQNSTLFHVKPLLPKGHPHARHDPHPW